MLNPLMIKLKRIELKLDLLSLLKNVATVSEDIGICVRVKGDSLYLRLEADNACVQHAFTITALTDSNLDLVAAVFDDLLEQLKRDI
jgi:hypothetical protein